MPSGRTHDRITLWSLPLVAGVAFGQTLSGNLTLLVSGGFLFGGLMFGPDLDIYSRQYKRWGWLRWLWIPYQKSIRHRSFLSHGPLVGTTVRTLYLLGWITLLTWLGLSIAELFWDITWSWRSIGELAIASLQQYYIEWIALFVGLELGAMSHYISDWGGSAYKRFKNRGLGGLLGNKKRSRPYTKQINRMRASPSTRRINRTLARSASLTRLYKQSPPTRTKSE